MAELAEMAGLAGPSVISYLETGQRAPQIDTVEKLAYALGLSPAALAFGREDDSAPTGTLRAAGIGDRLRQMREERGLSARALGEKAELSHTAVGNIERSGTMPTIATAEGLAKALKLSPAWLAFGVGPQVAPSRRVMQSAAHP